MTCYEVNGEGIIIPLANTWEWIPVVEKLRDRYSVIVLQRSEYAFVPYYNELDLDDIFLLLQAFKNDEVTNVKQLEL